VEASEITQAKDGRRVGSQAWAIYGKIRAVDELVLERADARTRIREAHPEVSFWAWNQRQAFQVSKKTRAGREQRLALVEEWLGAGVLSAARGAELKRDLADDDILDAFAALWTATRIEEGRAETLPNSPPRDQLGLRMEIVY
jgi:predicted RNase H-like nuclease